MYENRPVNFGNLPPLPEGYSVVWSEAVEHYIALGPDDWEGSISVDKYWCRAQAFWHHRTRTTGPGAPSPLAGTVQRHDDPHGPAVEPDDRGANR